VKIDAVLARHPWPWRSYGGNAWAWLDAKGFAVPMLSQTTEAALLELVAAHVARSTTQATHSEECWRWHHGCAVAMVRRGESEMAELLAAAGDILLSFTAGTECRIPHHQVERLFKAVHGKDAKTPWDDDEEDKQ